MQLDRHKRTLELLFTAFVGVVVASAFVAALHYDFVSARAPLIIMAPLLILIGIQFNRTRKASRSEPPQPESAPPVSDDGIKGGSAMALIGWMALLMLSIYVVGHYVGIAVFMFVLLHLIAKESMRLSIIVAASVTGSIYFLFEQVFNIELYRGLIIRMFFG